MRINANFETTYFNSMSSFANYTTNSVQIYEPTETDTK